MSIKEEIKRSKFGISEFSKPSPKKLKMLASSFGAFCTALGVSLVASNYKLAGMIVSSLGLFCDKVLINFFSFEENPE